MTLHPPEQPFQLGDPVPWFSAATIAGGEVNLHVDAGRWVVLAFLGSLTDGKAVQVLSDLLSERAHFREEHLVVYAVLQGWPADISVLAELSSPALAFLDDRDGRLARQFGAEGSPRTVILDPMLRAVANIAWDDPGGHQAMVLDLIRNLPPVDQSTGVEMSAPILIIPRVFDFSFCDLLVSLYDELGGDDSGFLLDQNGVTRTVINHRLKQRKDLVITDPDLRAVIRHRFATRIVPAMERFFQYRPTRIDRMMVSCYDSATGGHFFRHRDNVNAGAQHRRFAVSINLNKDYEGCDLIFPEFGRRTYRPPVGGAVVFSCGALHEVTPVRTGRRYAFVPFLYGESDAALRTENNAKLGVGEAHYVAGYDRLFPDEATS